MLTILMYPEVTENSSLSGSLDNPAHQIVNLAMKTGPETLLAGIETLLVSVVNTDHQDRRHVT